jgi:hypothetical protein
MKNMKQSKKPRAKAVVKREKPLVEAPAAVSVTKPAGPPLAGEALEQKVAEVLCVKFRETAERASLREECQGADDAAIETAIVSPRVKGVVEPVARAFALEQSVAVIRLLLTNARLALESEKPTAAQILALKIVFETFVEKIMASIGGGLWQDAFSLLGFSDYEKSLIENLMQLVRGQRAPVSEVPQRLPDPGENDEAGD